MATFSAIFAPATALPTKVASLGATSSSAELVFYNDAIIAIQCTGNCQVAFGTSGMAAAAATAWYVPVNEVHTFDLGQWDRIRVYNPGASSIDVYVLALARG